MVRIVVRVPTTTSHAPRQVVRTLVLAGCLVLLLLSALAAVAVGTRDVAPAALWSELTGHGTPGSPAALVLQLRLPRLVIGLLAGAGLAVAGALTQAVTRNALADPGILGTTAGAAFAVAMTAGLAGTTTPAVLLAVAFTGAALATLGVHAIGSLGRGRTSPVQLVLAGTALGAVLTGITQAIVLADRERFTVMQAWRSGTLAGRTLDGTAPAALLVAVGLLLALAMSSQLNAVALGDDLATALGTNVVRVRLLAVVAVALLAGTATALAGPIAFVGLVVPHVARMVVGPDQRWIIATSILLGPALLLASDVLARLAVAPAELPAGVVTAVVGAPFLIALVRRRGMGEL